MLPKLSLPFGPLEPALFLERPNRFLVLCRLVNTQEVVKAHLADPGRLTGLLQPGVRIHVRFVDQPQRKTKWSVVLVEAPSRSQLVSVQSTLVNQLTQKVLQSAALKELSQWGYVRSEYSYGQSRWDFLLQNRRGQRLLLEVKSVTLVENEVAMFPDGVTARGRRHLLELARLQSQTTWETAVLFVVQRQDAQCFRPADHIDPAFGQALRQASRLGVRILARTSFVSLDYIQWGKPLCTDFS